MCRKFWALKAALGYPAAISGSDFNWACRFSWLQRCRAWSTTSSAVISRSFDRIGCAARCLSDRPFSAQPSTEPRGHLSVHVALQ